MVEPNVLADIIRRIPSVESVFVPTEKDMNDIFSAEEDVKAGSGMPLRNDSLIESKKRPGHLIVVHRDGLDGRQPFHSVTWETGDGKIVAFDVPDALRHEVEGRDDLIWISDDFVMETSSDIADVVCVLHPAPVSFIGENEGVKDPIFMYPATPVDQLIRRKYSVESSPELATAVLSFYPK